MKESTIRSLRMKGMLEQLEESLEAWGEAGDVSPFDATVVAFEAVNRFMERVGMNPAFRFDLYTTAMKRGMNIDPMLPEEQALKVYREQLTAATLKGLDLDTMNDQVMATFEMINPDFGRRTNH